MTEKLSLEFSIKVDGTGGENGPASSSAARRLRQDFAASGLASSISPIETATNPDARSGEAVSATAFLLELAPIALEQLFGVIRDLFQRPGAPSVKIHVRDGDSETEIEFDPKTLDPTSVTELTAQLRGQL